MANTLRSCIIAKEGSTLMALDASQIELRVLAILSQDPQLLEDLLTDDLHMATAIRMYGWSDDEDEMKARRYDAKQGNFALVYGADSFKLSTMLECSIEEAEEFMAEHRVTYPVLYQWMFDTKEKVKQDGYTVSPLGRIRHIPDLKNPSWKIREHAEREIINTIVQGTAVDIVKMAMLHMRRILPPQIRLVLQVHDEMVWEIPETLVDLALIAANDLPEYFPDYPFSVKVGKIYGEL